MFIKMLRHLRISVVSLILSTYSLLLTSMEYSPTSGWVFEMYIITTTNSYCIIWLSLLFVVFIPCSRKSPVGVNASTISKIILCINLVPSFKFFHILHHSKLAKTSLISSLNAIMLPSLLIWLFLSLTCWK